MTFLLGGIMTAIFNMAGFLSLWVLLGASAAAYAALILLRLWLKKSMRNERLIYPVDITYGGVTVGVTALADTGNSLKDPITDAPVIIAEFAALSKCLPENVKTLFEGNRQDDLHEILHYVEGTAFASRIRLLPFSSVGQESGTLIGFKPDSAKTDKREISAIIGICNSKLDANGDYNALIPPDILLNID